MTSSGPTILSLLAAGVYILVALACAVAMKTASSMHQSPTHRRGWMVLALFFAALVIVRLLDLEHGLADALRDWLRASGNYGNRRATQAMVAVVVPALTAVAGVAWIYRGARHSRGRRDFAVAVAHGAGLAMVVLITLRLISHHGVDSALYGPLKLNWVIDLGASLTAGASALFYIRAVRQRRQRPPGDERQ